ncbi:PulJ/GspJ family protein [Ureibacillus chungkukjangi]|uniref:Pilin/secretion family protein with methylation motif n=1 Tax=Ureibacillus chungkukjangi TaxID=1202712 RepID=A0A318TT84_9BACL|nr:prepilin-type N-terminal cleavage/methylation domain-containing protein [Ureibacillus chungkukjangi]PYF02869.1 pilin/secretion family protein with methylation motif [Ureibacillus chungkukjangi]
MKNDQQSGFSLVETLVIIVLLSIVSLITWNIFFQGSNYTNKAVSKNQLQQEANIIISKLTKIHLQSDTYKVHIDDCKFTIEATSKGIITDKETFENNQLCITLKNVPEDVNPKTDDVNLELIIMRNDSNRKLKMEVLLQRLKEYDAT